MQIEPMTGEGLKVAIPLYLETLTYNSESRFVRSDEVVLAMSQANQFWYQFILDGDIIGIGGFTNYKPLDRSADPFIAIVPTMRGKGYGRLGGELLLKEGIGRINLKRISSTNTTDAPSISILRHLGFTHEGTHYKARYRDGQYVDTSTYGWVRKE